jgi:peptidyl-prolyl cis-trans isomerase B (cyclophilin B)
LWLFAATAALGGPAFAAQAPSKAKPRPVAAKAAATPIPPTEAVIDTSEGEIVVRLLEQVAPGHVRHFIKIASAGGYDGTTFHRVIRGGIIQGGDPLSKDPDKASQYGTGGLGLLKAEFSERPFSRGVVAAVRRPSDPNSGGNQFFIVLTEQPSLKGQFTIYGEVVSGIEVADKIGDTPADGDRAKARVEIRRVTLRPAAASP